jgi:glycosyltransferase involved in cell wall biosynthesis
MTTPCVSVILPVYNEDGNIAACLRGLSRALGGLEHEILVCYDFDEDRTLPAIAAMPDKPAQVKLVRNELGRGAASAIRAGLRAARGDVLAVTMADLSDPPEVIPLMARKIREEGADVVGGSRYMAGGSQTGGPPLKTFLSRAAGLSLYWIAGLGTHDATTNFRAYSRRLIERVDVESRDGMELALELTVKAHRLGLKVDEVPSSWTDRTSGESRFRLMTWLPRYLRWYVLAMRGPLLAWTLLAGAVAMAAISLAHRR